MVKTKVINKSTMAMTAEVIFTIRHSMLDVSERLTENDECLPHRFERFNSDMQNDFDEL